MNTPSVAPFSDLALNAENSSKGKDRSASTDLGAQTRARHFEQALLTTAAPSRSDRHHDRPDPRDVRSPSRANDKRDRDPIRPERPRRDDIRSSDRPQRNEARSDDARRSEVKESSRPDRIDRDADADVDGPGSDDKTAASDAASEGSEVKGGDESRADNETEDASTEEAGEGSASTGSEASVSAMGTTQILETLVTGAETAPEATTEEPAPAETDSDTSTDTDTDTDQVMAAGMEQAAAAMAASGPLQVETNDETSSPDAEPEVMVEVDEVSSSEAGGSTGSAEGQALGGADHATAMGTQPSDSQKQVTTAANEAMKGSVNPSMTTDETSSDDASGREQGTSPDLARDRASESGMEALADSAVNSSEGQVAATADNQMGAGAAPVIEMPVASVTASGAENPNGTIAGVGTVTRGEQAMTVRTEATSQTSGTAQTEGNDAGDPVWRQVQRALGSIRTTPSGDRQFTIRLRPAELGSVVVRIRTGEAGTAVALVADSRAAANQLQQQRQLLVSELEEGGLLGVAVDVGMSGNSEQGQAGAADGDAQDGSSNSTINRVGFGSGRDDLSDLGPGIGLRGRRQRTPSTGLVDLDL